MKWGGGGLVGGGITPEQNKGSKLSGEEGINVCKVIFRKIFSILKLTNLQKTLQRISLVNCPKYVR